MSNFKQHSAENRINENMFEDPDNIYFNETDAINELNKKLSENNDYILPEGYKKVIEKKVLFTHRIFLDAMSPVYKDVYEIINEILSGNETSNKTISILTSLDYSKAFNKFSHSKIIEALARLGLRKSLIPLVGSYLENRSLVVQFVHQ